MGYDYYVNGEITIRPRLPEKVVNDLLDKANNLAILDGGEEDTVGVVNGEITVIPGDSWTKVVCEWDEPFGTALDLPLSLKHIATAAKKSGASVAGALFCTGEDGPDLCRFRIDEDYVVHSEEPVFAWPNGDTGWSNGRYS